MKRSICILLAVLMMMCLASCGGAGNADKATGFEVAMISDSGKIENGSFAETVWENVESFAEENALSVECYVPNEPTKEAYLASIESAVNNKAKIIVLAGSEFETTVFSAQGIYPDVFFLLIDGIPHDTGDKYGASANTIGVIFAEEQAGYLAGYAAVKGGYKKLGFMGGEDLPFIKRYGYGFVQGAAAAAQEIEQKIELYYKYNGTLEPSEDVVKAAAGWYDDGVEVIFACGGTMGHSVMEAAEKNRGKVIGADTDQSNLSGTVIASAVKETEVVIYDMLDNYIDGKFVGGTAFNYTAQNDGVNLHMDSGFTGFGKKDYDDVYKKLKNNEIELKKDTAVDDIRDLTGEWVTIK